ncbi:alpha-ketoglutarate-dependent dioxygenase AlkB [Paucihalobacter ruber]|uniref:Alpha-ketoglutarate-dependent dioxygenase AlkB n=1 Tax=Paucihalobacter ruber TaxID=2567861 RepID=A0A506PP56_9FLAO|nr:alpha-ketoglutarate-dependent dioxygenase AlkB [Paucihalobacter ruber]TPV35491.1 alpha-ketoglutarate-dependent dioxygenase AlkB [Paucihalobacter ruber]
MRLFNSEKIQINLPNAELIYYPEFFSSKEADHYFKELLNQTNWRQDDIKVFGKTYQQPRLTALYGDSGKPYSYSNITMYPEIFTADLKNIKTLVEEASQHEFNTVLLNLYRNGQDSNGWHADNEKELGKNPLIASVSFGATRPFHFKHRKIKTERHQLILNHGSLLIMKGEMQHHWLHQIAKTKKPIAPRINLTFRCIN